VANVAPPLTVMAFVNKMTDTCKSTASNAIQVKKWNKINTEETLEVISRLEKAEQDSLTTVYVQFVTILTELKKVLSQKLKHLCSRATILSEITITKTIAITLS
jgi:hypothetical protein